MSTSVFSLPVPLVLLIHLHLLQYPHANKPEYDHNLFNADVRGLRDRTRTMEDVCYFLVFRIEGTKERVRKVISTYPCLQPIDTTAFRTSLAKYLENLRHASIFPAAPSKQPRPDSKLISGATGVAWWWKDVVVRRSLLDECAEEKFERLVLALSTHALLKGSATHVPSDETHVLLRGQPRTYMTRLAAFQSSYNSWARAASILNQEQYDLRSLRTNVQNHGVLEKYASLPTEKLVALADSKLQDLLDSQWAGSSGCSALKFLADLAGLKQPDSSPMAVSRSAKERGATDGIAVSITPPSPLPIAAAHHPATLRKLGKRIFPKDTVDIISPNLPVASQPHAVIALAGRVDAEARMLQALTDGLARIRKNMKDVQARLARAPKPTSKRALQLVNIHLWQEAQQIRIDFEPTISDDSFVALGLSEPGTDVNIQPRIDSIRQDLLPKYPPVPTAASQPTASSLPQPKTRSPPQTPRSARQLEISTAPDTVKPRSRIVLEKHHAGRNFNKHPLFSDAADRQSESMATSDSEPSGATPRAQKHSLTMTPPELQSLLALETYPSRSEYPYDEDEDEFGALGEGPSMSVRDLLLQADTTHFDLIDDDPSELGDQSFGWA
ncbi:hypothetical protein B0H19DRAFT_982261 [Mycena capillaripes]|nr:hypothetical protein B0H19DRAFT_982261 [Mycena capillaripes]